MSRAFINEDDHEEAPIIPARAVLPEGVINYVTPTGLKELNSERDSLSEEPAKLSTENEDEHRRELTVIQGKMNLLNDRIASARVIDPKDQPQDEVRFGAKVTFKNLTTKASQSFRIVGVDEADLSQNKIAFIAPIAVALTGAKLGEQVEFKLGSEIRLLEVTGIEY